MTKQSMMCTLHAQNAFGDGIIVWDEHAIWLVLLLSLRHQKLSIKRSTICVFRNSPNSCERASKIDHPVYILQPREAYGNNLLIVLYILPRYIGYCANSIFELGM
jgi:hypothetical protein